MFLKYFNRNSFEIIFVEFEYKIEKAAEPEIEKKIRDARKAMEKAAKDLDFLQAAKLRDEIKSLQDKLQTT